MASSSSKHVREQRKRAKLLAGVALGVACPPLGAVMGIAGFLRGARRYAQNPDDHDAATSMVLGFGGLGDVSKK